MSRDAIEAVTRRLEMAKTFAEIFGPVLNDSDLKHAFRKLAKLVHPDMAAQRDQQIASEAFNLLEKFYRAAGEELAAHRYDRSFAPGVHLNGRPNTLSSGIIQSSRAVYVLEDEAAYVGDYSRIYEATEAGSPLRAVLVKIASHPTNNARLEWEAQVLARFKDHPDLGRVASFVPLLLDSFLVSGSGGTRYRAIVVQRVEGFMSLRTIVEPGPLLPQDAAWICRRVLAQPLAASMAGLVHCAIVPDHVLVHPVNREPRHIGWAHAVETDAGHRITSIIERWRAFYPPEVFARKPVDYRTDLYMASMTMLYLCGGDPKRKKQSLAVPYELSSIIGRCIEDAPERRPKDGRELLDEFTRAVRGLWGRTYRPLPVR